MRNSHTLLWVATAGATGLGIVALERSIRRKKHAEQATARIPVTDKPVRLRPIARDFDSIFLTYGHGVPVAYLRALAKRESHLNPNEQSGPAWGLLQVIEVVRKDFNERHGTGYSREHLLRPTINVNIAAWLLNTIVDSYGRNHPRVPNMHVDWNNPRFVELVTFGWNAGWSERTGVGRVAHHLERVSDAEAITIDTVHESARAAGASRHLQNAAKVKWCKSVARYYMSERLHDLDRIARAKRTNA